jgi:hypothetical protein
MAEGCSGLSFMVACGLRPSMLPFPVAGLKGRVQCQWKALKKGGVEENKACWSLANSTWVKLRLLQQALCTPGLRTL